MKIVPASRLVSEASLEPPSSNRNRAIRPTDEAVAGFASMTAGEKSGRLQNCCEGPAYQLVLKIWLAAAMLQHTSLIEIHIEFVGAIAANQRQFEGRAFWVCAGR